MQAAWPGATMDDTLKQVTERIERKLQETRGLDFLRSYTKPGLTTIFVNSERFDESLRGAGHLVSGAQERRRHSSHAAGRASSDPASTTSSATPTALIYGFTADGFTHRELRDYVEDIRSRLLQVPDVSKIELLGAQDEQIFVEFSTQQLAGLGIDRAALIAALQAQNAVSPSGALQTGDENAVAAGFRRLPLRAGHSRRQFPVERAADPAARHRASAPRLFRSAAADVSRQRQAGHRPRHRNARRRRCSGARPKCNESDRREHRQSAARHRRDACVRSACRRQDRHQRVHGICCGRRSRSSWRSASSVSAFGPARSSPYRFR